MSSGDKEYDNAQRLDALVARVAALDSGSGAPAIFYPGNTVTAASLQNLAAFTISAGDAVTNSVWEIEVWGNGIQGSTKQSLRLTMMLNGVATSGDITFGTVAFAAANNPFRFRVTGRAVCHSSGAGGQWTSYLDAVVSDFSSNLGPSNNNFAAGFSTESTTLLTQDTTVPFDIGVSAAWGATTGAPTLTSRRAIRRRVL